MNNTDLMNNLKAKIKKAKVASRHLKKHAYFDRFSTSMMLYLAQWSENARVLQVLACHPQQSIREAVALNPHTNYETLYYLLTDNVDVIRLVLSFAKLEQEDFYTLAEKFSKEIYPNIELVNPINIADPSKYVQLIKLEKNNRWVNSQSICLLHNHHVGLKAMKNIDIKGFSPFTDNGLSILLDAKKTRIQEIKDNVEVFKRSPLTDCMNRIQQCNYKKYEAAEWRTKNKAHEITFDDAEKHFLNYFSEAERKMLSIGKSNEKIVKKEEVDRQGSERSFSSHDKKIFKSWLAKVRRDGLQLSKVPKKFKTYEMCVASVTQHGRALKHAPKSMITQELCSEAIKNNGSSLEYVPPEYANYEMCESAVGQAGLALQHVPEIFRDESLCYKAVLSNGFALKYTPQQVINQKMCDVAVAEKPYAIGEVPLGFLSEDLCLEAVQNSAQALEYIPESFKTNTVCAEAFKKSSYVVRFLPEHLLSEELIMDIVENHGGDVSDILQNIPKNKLTEKICTAAVKEDGNNLEFIPRRLQSESICLTAVKNYGPSLKYVSNSALSESICWAAVSEWAGAIRYVPEGFKSVELCLLAMKTGYSWDVLPHMSKNDFRKHPYLLSRAAKNNYPSNGAFNQLLEAWISDDSIDEADIKSCLGNAPARLKAAH